MGFNVNQVVQDSDLNAIAIDLGKVDFSAFTNGQPYAVDSLNQITADLTGAGILNTLNKCNPTLLSSTITINTGVIVFSDGSKIKNVNALTFTVADLTAHQYIYAVKDTGSGVASIELSGTLPTSGLYVPICEIYNSTLVDKRQFSISKNAYSGTAIPQVVRITDMYSLTDNNWHDVYSVDLLNQSAKVIYFCSRKAYKRNCGCVVYNADRSSATTYYTDEVSVSGISEFRLLTDGSGNSLVQVKLRIENGKMIISCRGAGYTAYFGADTDIIII